MRAVQETIDELKAEMSDNVYNKLCLAMKDAHAEMAEQSVNMNTREIQVEFETWQKESIKQAIKRKISELELESDDVVEKVATEQRDMDEMIANKQREIDHLKKQRTEKRNWIKVFNDKLVEMDNNYLHYY